MGKIKEEAQIFERAGITLHILIVLWVTLLASIFVKTVWVILFFVGVYMVYYIVDLINYLKLRRKYG